MGALETLVQGTTAGGPVGYHYPILSRRVRRVLEYVFAALSAVLFSYLILKPRW